MVMSHVCVLLKGRDSSFQVNMLSF